LIIRQFQPSDISEIDKIFQATQLGVPSRQNLLVSRVFESHGKILAYGVLKIFAELHVTLDPSLTSYTKAKIIGEGTMIGIDAAFQNRLERVHAILDDEREIEILKKHFGFVEVAGKLLVKEI